MLDSLFEFIKQLFTLIYQFIIYILEMLQNLL
ncbi:hypothetical protein SAMN05443253_104212 [Bacillus sp. OK048]|nr:hypothetical protein SAMN05443253_104212 [Bacillus sp. OK048]